jgi:formate hydrogenlyase subunit 6/NADH:ubiquinone oxidoreductase subunit I
MKLIKESALTSFVDALIKEQPRTVVGVKSKKGKFVYEALDSAKELRLDFDVTVASPKNYFLPSAETLLNYSLADKKVQAVNEVQPVIVIGVHPYDLIALEQMDVVFKDTNQDANYLQKRQESVVIGVNIQKVSPYAFAGSMGTSTTGRGFDLMLTKVNGEYVVEEGSGKGSDLLKKYAKTSDAAADAVKEAEKVKAEVASRFQRKLSFPAKDLPQLMGASYNHAVWEEKAKKCLSCGSCNLVCPTCYCFDVQDITEVNLTKGMRVRTWDGCLLEDFAKVGSGENFREHRASRYRHRFLRKGKYLSDKFGFIACVGCGRCASACLPDIADPAKVFNTLKEGSK